MIISIILRELLHSMMRNRKQYAPETTIEPEIQRIKYVCLLWCAKDHNFLGKKYIFSSVRYSITTECNFVLIS